MNFKKKVSGSWVDTPHYIYKTATDTLTTLPAVLYPNAATATVGLKGQMVQSSQPSPTIPIQPQECGERTGNLFDVNDTSQATTSYCTISVSDGILTQTNLNISNLNRSNWKIDGLQTGSSYILSMSFDNPNASEMQLRIYDENNDNQLARNTATRATIGEFSVTFTATATSCYVRIYSNTSSTTNDYTVVYSNIMLNAGSTALPYEPYGQYKIPILNNSTTTPVYLGEVQSTRQIKKLVLTGEESWDVNPATNVFFATINNALGTANVITSVCSHYQAVDNKALYINIDNYCSCIRANASVLWIKDTNYDSSSYYAAIEGFKSYLAAQYAAGTPVTVWYVLAEPTTGIVNEPLRKIGTYADEVSGITIPTIAGANTLSVGTTLQPSEVTVNYKGWHPVATVKEWDGSEWRDEQPVSLLNASSRPEPLTFDLTPEVTGIQEETE